MWSGSPFFTGEEMMICVVVLPSYLEWFFLMFFGVIKLVVGENTQGREIVVLSFSPLWTGSSGIFDNVLTGLHVGENTQGSCFFILSFSPL